MGFGLHSSVELSSKNPLRSSCASAAAMWRDLFVLCLVPALVLSKTVDYGSTPGYTDSSSAQTTGGYKDDGYSGSTNSYSKDDGYGGKQDCPYGQERVTKTVFKEFCEAYTDRVCRTTHGESCTDVPDKNCRAVVTNQQNRKCFDVTELVCKLREDVKYETVQVGFTVQKCHKVQERVCDTVYDTSFTTKENHMCIRVNNPFCKFEEKTIVDKTCRTVTKFDCPTEAKDNGMGSSGGYGDSTGYGKGGDDYNSGYGKGGDDYGIEQPQCKRSQTTKCYDTPRTVSVPRCSQNSEKVCESMPTRVPTVNERQHCHNEDKKVCELEERTQPKQVKKYVYTKQCRKVPRKVCENADNKSLVPSCVSSMRKECTHTPTESCDDIPKQHCFKVALRGPGGCRVRPQFPGTEPTYPEPTYPAPEPTYQTPEPTYPEPTYPAPQPTYPESEGY